MTTYVEAFTHQHDDLSFREARPQQLSDGKNSSRHLFCRVLVIVSSHPQHHHLDKTTDTLVTAPSAAITPAGLIYECCECNRKQAYTLFYTTHRSGLSGKRDSSFASCVFQQVSHALKTQRSKLGLNEK